MKKVLSLLLSLAMLLSITSGLNLTAYAEIIDGTCGENVTYSLDTSTGVLTISGTGDMEDYYYMSGPFYNNSNIKSIVIAEGVTSIGNCAFDKCTNLTDVTIPDSVSSIGKSSFGHCTSLTEINVDSGNTKYLSQDGVLFNKDKTELIQCPAGNARTSYSIPNSVTSIGQSVFYHCTSLKKCNNTRYCNKYRSKCI